MDINSLYKLYLEHPEVTTDSRHCPAGSMFFALRGDNFDGNRFAQKALASGCALAVVDNPAVAVAGDERYILTDDVLHTMQELAHLHREHFSGPVIQVTGTNGKTTTKELITAVLSRKYRVLATQGNHNNHIGVPLTLLSLRPEHEIAVIETGANHPGEIAFLARIVDPDCGLITNVGKAHLEGFGSFEGVIHTKGELYDYLRGKKDSFIFLHGENPHLVGIAGGLKTIKYGLTSNDAYEAEGKVTGCSPFLKMEWKSNLTPGSAPQHVTTHLIGAYNADNAMAAIAVGLHFGVEAKDISKALEEYQPTNDRSELRVTANNRLIVDAYNANPTSMGAALRNFSVMEGDKKMVILGDMRELGDASAEEHQHIADFLQKAGFDTVWLVGDNFKAACHPFRCFSTVDEVIEELKAHPIEGHLILIKGSNGTKLFRLPEWL